MDDKLFGVLSTIGGLVIGWTLNEFSSFIKSSRENTKTLNQTLYTQLEIRDVINKTDYTSLQKQLTAILTERFPSEVNKEANILINQMLFSFIKNDLNNRFSSRIEELIIEYNRQVSDLSKISPFTTYYISNKDMILDYLGYVNRYLATIKKELDKPVIVEKITTESSAYNTLDEMLNSISEDITPLLRENVIENIESDITIIAKEIGVITRIKTHYFLKRTRNMNVKDVMDMSKINTYLDSVVGKK